MSPTRGARRGGEGAVPGRVARYGSGHVRERRAIVAARAAVVHIVRHTTRGTREVAARAPARVGSDRGLSSARFGSAVARIGRGTALCRGRGRRIIESPVSAVSADCIVRRSALGHNVSGNLAVTRTGLSRVDHGGVEGSTIRACVRSKRAFGQPGTSQYERSAKRSRKHMAKSHRDLPCHTSHTTFAAGWPVQAKQSVSPNRQGRPTQQSLR